MIIFSGNVLLVGQVSLSDNFLLSILIASSPVLGITNFKTNFSFFIRHFSYMIKKSRQKLKYLKKKKNKNLNILRTSFFQLTEIDSDMGLGLCEVQRSSL